MKKYFWFSIIVTAQIIFKFALIAQSGWTQQESGTSADLNGLSGVQYYSYPYQGSRVITVGDSGTILYSDDYGVTWNVIPSPVMKSLKGVSMADADTGIIVGSDGIILRIESIDGMLTAKDYTSSNPDSARKSINDVYLLPVPGRAGYAVGDSGLILRTTNHGINWDHYTTTRISQNLHAYSYQNYDRMYAVGDSGTILKSTSPKYWVPKSSSDYSSYNFHTVFFDWDTGWIAGNKGKIVSTNSGGNVWINRSSGVSTTLRSIFFLDRYAFPQGIGWAVGDSGVILKTTDNGIHWSLQESGTTRNLKKVIFFDENIGVIVGDSGLILRTISGGSPGPMFEAVPSALDFGEIFIGTSKTASIFIRNNGTAPLVISNVISDNSSITINPTSATIGPFSSGEFSITVSLNTGESINASITFTANDSLIYHNVTVKAKCIDPIKSGWFWLNPLPQGNNLYDVRYIGNNTFVGVGNLGTFIKSTDKGVSWSGKNYCGSISGDFNSSFFLDPLNGFIIGSSGIILKTTDGGFQFSAINSSTTSHLKSISFFDALNGYAVGGVDRYSNGFGSIHRTSDGGDSWNTLYASNDIDLNAIVTVDSVTAIASGGDRRFGCATVLTTTDGGFSWKQFNFNYGELMDIARFDQSTLVAVGKYGLILRTTDYGKTWSIISTENSGQYSRIISINNMDGVILGSSKTVLKTNDGGLSWNVLSTDTDENFIAGAFADDENGIALGSDYYTNGYVKTYRTTDGGVTWSDCLLSYNKNTLQSVFFSNENDGLVVGGSGTLLRTTDGGTSWSRLLQGTLFEYLGIAFNDVQMVDGHTGYIVGNSGVIVMTSNSGDDWVSLTSGTANNLRGQWFIDPDVGYVVGDNGTILKTTNQGNNWINQTNTTKRLNDVSFITPNKGVAVGQTGTILRTTNGGTDWFQQKISDNDLFSVWLHSDTGVAVGMYGDVFVTTNAGASWFKNDVGVSNNWYDVHFSNPNTGTIVGGNGIILRTYDGGFNWTVQHSSTNRHLYGVSFIDENIGMIVGERGTILKTTTGGVVSVHDGPSDIAKLPERFELFQNYPNPFNPSTIIRYQLPVESWVTLKIYNLLGQEVSKLVDERQPAGHKSIEWNTSAIGGGIASGVYFYQIHIRSSDLKLKNDYISTKKMIVIR